MSQSIFGELLDGTLENPAISKESNITYLSMFQENLCKTSLLDTNNKEGIIDVTTHL